jgi:N-acetylmuramoyl-L-alanine amidase
MASYFRSWLPTLALSLESESNPTVTVEEESPTTPTNSVSFQDVDNDTPPAFPAIESAQRITSASVSPSSKLLSPSTLMPPPPLPAPRIPGPPAPSSGSSLMPPPTTTKPPTPLSKTKRREKVVLAPGHSPLDWAALKNSGADLRVCCATAWNVPLLISGAYRHCRVERQH